MGKGSYTQCDIRYHIVWIRKYGYEVLKEKIADRLRINNSRICSSGYFCRTVVPVTHEILKSYIKDQTDDIEKLFKITK